MTGLRTGSLRRRVTVSGLAVLAAVLLAVGVLTDVLFAAQSRADLRADLGTRAGLAVELAADGTDPDELVRRIEAPGIRAVVVEADGTVHGSGRRGGPRLPPEGRGARGPETLRAELAGGAELTLVASDVAVTAARQRLRRTLFLLSIAALAVAGLVMLATARLALAPLDALTGVARSITRGDRGRRLAPSRTDTELGRAAEAFDGMLDALEGAERQARAAEATARTSEARTRRFVADAAHELRTPLAGVQAAAEAAVAPELEVEERDRLHLLLLRESRRAGRLVDDLLVLARLDAGLELRREPVDLLAVARGEAERVRLLAPDREVAVTGDTVTVPGDAARLGQVLANLLDNARRHAPPGGRITVRVGPGPAVLVTDTGAGVPPADRERIFDRLVRLDDARSADAGGAGLGLAIARGIARAHGGDLRCVDPPDGRGAAFALTLPASRGDRVR
ncbi:MAG TPA: ATP-binding protein [Pseudonocardia sp.]|nr:ATP-binding protein [Pseudonocardia sp.]